MTMARRGLAALIGTSRHTVRRAIGDLIVAGLVVAEASDLPSRQRNIVGVREFRHQLKPPREMNMARAKSCIAVTALALLATTGFASAAPFTTTGHEAKSQVEKADYRRCWIEDGEEVCRYVSEYDELDDEYADDDVYAYDPGPPVILGFGVGGLGFHGHGHGGHGHGHR
jgi:hypothetical protein